MNSLVRDKVMLNVAYRGLQITKRGQTSLDDRRRRKINEADHTQLIYLNMYQNRCKEVIRNNDSYA